MNLTETQLKSISKYLVDISKLVFAATVLGFFVPIGDQTVSVTSCLVGIAITGVVFAFSVYLIK